MTKRITRPVAALLVAGAVPCGSVVASSAASTCPSEAALRSQNSARKTRIVFLNARHGVINVFWINYQGRRQFFRSLAPGEKWSYDTFATHPWVVTDAGGGCLGVHFADAGADAITIH
jgi:von Hippel-Lindau disease tumor supressor